MVTTTRAAAAGIRPPRWVGKRIGRRRWRAQSTNATPLHCAASPPAFLLLASSRYMWRKRKREKEENKETMLSPINRINILKKFLSALMILTSITKDSIFGDVYFLINSRLINLCSWHHLQRDDEFPFCIISTNEDDQNHQRARHSQRVLSEKVPFFHSHCSFVSEFLK